MPGNHFFEGNIHPITQVMNDICNIFKSIGFSIFPGDEVEDELNEDDDDDDDEDDDLTDLDEDDI